MRGDAWDPPDSAATANITPHARAVLSQGEAALVAMGFEKGDLDGKDKKWLTGKVLSVMHGAEGGEWR